MLPERALLFQAKITELDRPSHRVLTAFRAYLAGSAPKGSDRESLPLIAGRAESMLEDDIDLVAFRKSQPHDLLSKLLRDHWVFQKRASADSYDRTTTYAEKYVTWTVSAVSSIFAAFLLIGAIVALYAVKNPKVKLAMVAGFTVLFALGIALLTTARRAEIFCGTAAYAAVLVVFVSGDLGDSKTQCLIQVGNGIYKSTACPS
jgi:uncharacterized protein DUF6594